MSINKYTKLFLILSIIFFYKVKSQNIYGTFILAKISDNGDTVGIVNLKNINVVGKRSFKNKRAKIRFSKLEKKVRKVYPYAKLASIKYKEGVESSYKLKTNRERKKHFKNIEKELKKKYGSSLKKLTISEGKILVKLMTRETGKTGYEILKEFRGLFLATFWQGIARVFGHNLKTTYNSRQEDRDIELIIKKIENQNK